MVTALALLAAVAASLPGRYDCTIERQSVVNEAGGQPGAAVGFPEAERDNWRFRAEVSRGDNADVTIEWPANPIQIAGRQRTLPLAPGQIAFVVPARGLCMFTEQMCLTLVELSARDDGTLAFSILPAGSSRAENGTRSILHVIFTGVCRRQNGS
jgi:hypothetical protein